MTPEEAIKKFHVPEGFEMRLFAAEPMVADPVAIVVLAAMALLS